MTVAHRLLVREPDGLVVVGNVRVSIVCDENRSDYGTPMGHLMHQHGKTLVSSMVALALDRVYRGFRVERKDKTLFPGVQQRS